MNTLHRRRLGLGALCTALLAGSAAVAALTLSPAAARAGSAPGPCQAADTQVWVGLGGGGGYAGGYGVPLEFSNMSKHSCTLSGYPGVSAVRGTHQIGPAATRMRESASPVTLAPGATAHAVLKVTDTGALCGRRGVAAAGVKVYAPGQRVAKTVAMPLRVCVRRAALTIGALHSGVGIPGYVTQ